MSFKEQLKNDIDIFINLEEFAEEINIDKKVFKGVITNPKMEDPKYEYEGVYNELDLKLYLESKEELKKYTTGKSITVNNNYYTVYRAYDEEGIFILELTKRGRF